MGLLGDFFEQAKDRVSDYRDDYDSSYSRSSERYANMSDERLRREIQRLKDMNGYDADRMGKIAAMKAELDSRRG